MRNRSGMFVAPELWISALVMTKIAAGTWDSFCSFLDTEVTWIFNRSSRLACPRLLPVCRCENRGTGENEKKRKSVGPVSQHTHFLVVTMPRARRKGNAQVRLKGWFQGTYSVA